MKYLALALLLCAVASLSNAQCFSTAMEAGQTHCQDENGTWRAVGETWRNSNCMDCTCSGCCASYSTPKQFPLDCESIFNQTACEYIVRKKDNPNVLCPIYSAVGK